MKLHIIEELEVNTGIDWWDENRRRINKVISEFNNWQTKSRFDEFEKQVVLARIEACRKYGNEHDFSDWQYDLLNEMETFINNC